MNYRHAFHAGNFGDCLKHALLVWLLRALQRKPGAIGILDTHAGIGTYDLTEGPATRTGEWRAGIGRLLDDPPEASANPGALADYVGLVRQLGLYPGSPALIRALLRPQDRLVCCELHPEDVVALRRLFARDPQVGVHHRDAWEAVRGLLPMEQKRGLVLIDPPFEQPDEFDRLAKGMVMAHHRFANGVIAAWYPIKHRTPVREFHTRLAESGVRDIVAAELWLREPLDPARLNGCGLAVVNPPYRFEEAGRTILAALLERLGTREAGEGWDVTRLADE